MKDLIDRQRREEIVQKLQEEYQNLFLQIQRGHLIEPRRMQELGREIQQAIEQLGFLGHYSYYRRGSVRNA